MEKIRLGCFAFCLIAFVPWRSNAQEKTSQELMITVENDFPFFLDYYYTAGQWLTYRKLAAAGTRLNKYLNKRGSDSTKVIYDISLGSKLYNPKNIATYYTSEMDRPYAGWSFINGSISRVKPDRAGKLTAEVGVVGHWSGMDRLQVWWHGTTDYQIPHGWYAQINDEVVINTQYHYMRGWKMQNKMELVSNSGVYAGTGTNKLSQEVTVRMFRFNSFNESAYCDARLGNFQGDRSRKEFFLFVGAGADVVATNIFLQGSLFARNRSGFTVNPLVFFPREMLGVVYSTHRNTLKTTLVFLGKEVAHGEAHRYASISYARRF